MSAVWALKLAHLTIRTALFWSGIGQNLRIKVKFQSFIQKKNSIWTDLSSGLSPHIAEIRFRGTILLESFSPSSLRLKKSCKSGINLHLWGMKRMNWDLGTLIWSLLARNQIEIFRSSLSIKIFSSPISDPLKRQLESSATKSIFQLLHWGDH